MDVVLKVPKWKIPKTIKTVHIVLTILMMLTHLGVHSIGHESGTAVALEQVNKELPALSEQLIQQGIQIRNQQLLQQCQQSSGRILSIQCPIEDNSTSAV